MQINEKQLAEQFKPGSGPLDGAAVVGVMPWGEYPCDGSFEGLEISLRLKSGGLAVLILDTLQSEGLTVRLAVDDETARAAAAEALRQWATE